jgi:hypothetical protein
MRTLFLVLWRCEEHDTGTITCPRARGQDHRLRGITKGKLEELSGGNVKPTGQFANVLQRDVAFPLLDLPNIAPVELTLKGELFLGQAGGFAQCTHAHPKLDEEDIFGVCPRHILPLCKT